MTATSRKRFATIRHGQTCELVIRQQLPKGDTEDCPF